MNRISTVLRAGCWVLSAGCSCLVLMLVLVLSAGADAGAAQAAANDSRLKVLSPADGSFVSGAIPLRADVQPPEAVTSVVFFVALGGLGFELARRRSA